MVEFDSAEFSLISIFSSLEISMAEEANHLANYSANNFSQQLYMLIQEVQSLKTKTDQLEKELTRLKSK